MDRFTNQQWRTIWVSGLLGFLALFFWLDYSFWTSVVIELGLISATIGIHLWKTSKAEAS